MQPKRFSILVAFLSLPACTLKPGPTEYLAAISENADFIASLETKSSLDFLKEAMPRMFPPQLKSSIPKMETIAQQALPISGLDINKIDRIHLFGKLADPIQIGLILEGLDPEDINATPGEDYRGAKIYAAENKYHLVYLRKLGMAATQNKAFLKEIVDVHNKKKKNILQGERGRQLKKLLGTYKKLDQLRIYLLTSPPSRFAIPQVQIQSAGAFLGVEKGFGITLAADPQDLGQLESKFKFGLIAIQGALAAGASNLGVKVDQDTLALVRKVLSRIRTKTTPKQFAISYSGNLQPLFEQGIKIGVQQTMPNIPKMAPVAPRPPAAPQPKK